MTEAMMRVTMLVAASKVGMVITALDKAVILENVTQATDAPAVAPKRTVKRSTKKLVSETRAGVAALAALAGGKKTHVKEIGAHMAKSGFAASSASPICTKLMEQGDIVRVADGFYQIAPKRMNGAGLDL